MPGLSLDSSLFCSVHVSAEAFLHATYPILRRHERSSNIFFAHALKEISTETLLTECQFTSQLEIELDAFSHAELLKSLWITLWSKAENGVTVLDLVLSCTQGSQGDLPVFLWTPHPQPHTLPQWLMPRIIALAECLMSRVTPERVFSVFGTSCLVKSFSKEWSRLTSFQIEPKPFYSAFSTYCTPQSFIDSAAPVPTGDVIRHAKLSDKEGVAVLCKGFADDSIYFPLTIESARLEAEELISKRLVWVYVSADEPAAICVAARNSANVSAITKVYTSPRWRQRGFAEKLVRNVTRRLFNCGKETVVLYVGHENHAQRVYDRIGFVGLCGKARPEGVEDVLELGFAGTKRGHW